MAGVGKPIKELVCLSSILNLASLSAENTAIINAKYGMYGWKIVNDSGKRVYLLSKIKTATDGATPKLISSASESNSFPISEYAFYSRAAIPSKKSNIAANITQNTTQKKAPSKAIIIAILPENKFMEVMVLGICFFIAFYLKISIIYFVSCCLVSWQ